MFTVCLLSKEKEIEIAWSLVGRGVWGCGRSWGRENHDQDIIYENIFSIKQTKAPSTATERLKKEGVNDQCDTRVQMTLSVSQEVGGGWA